MFESNRYQVREKSFSDGDQHEIYEDGELVLYSKIDNSEIRNDLLFVDKEEKTKLVVTSHPKLDVPVSYSIIDKETEETIGGLRKEGGTIKQEWKLIDGNNTIIATVKEDHLSLSLARRFLTTLIPFKYDVVSKKEEKIADIDGEIKLRDIYNINICGDIDPRLIVPAAVIIDSIERKM